MAKKIKEETLNLENDRDVRNLVYTRLQMSPDTSDYELQREFMEVFGERYRDMRILD